MAATSAKGRAKLPNNARAEQMQSNGTRSKGSAPARKSNRRSNDASAAAPALAASQSNTISLLYENKPVAALQAAMARLHQNIADTRLKLAEAQTDNDIIRHQYVTTIQPKFHNTSKSVEMMREEIEKVRVNNRLELRVYEDKLLALDLCHQENLHRAAVESQQLLAIEDEEMPDPDDDTSVKSSVESSLVGLLEKDQEFDMLRDNLSKEYTQLQQRLERDLSDLKRTCASHLEDFQANVEPHKKLEMEAIKEIADQHDKRLQLQHEAVITDLQQYYRNVMVDQAASIQAYDQETSKVQAKLEANALQCEELREAISKLRQPLAVVTKREKELQKAVQRRPRDQASLQHARGRLRFLDKKRQALEKVMEERRSALKALETGDLEGSDHGGLTSKTSNGHEQA